MSGVFRDKGEGAALGAIFSKKGTIFGLQTPKWKLLNGKRPSL
jgi:hypothetical protein